MAVETLTLAVGPDADSRVGTLSTTVGDIAGPLDATVVLLHVFSQEAYDEGVAEAGYDPENPPPAHTLATRLQSINSLADVFEREQIDYRIRGEIGTTTDRIIHAVEQTDTDMLFISGRRRSPTGKAVFGSTAHRLMMNAPCPVTFVREGLIESDDTS